MMNSTRDDSSNMSSSSSCRVRVGVRVRPLSAKEQDCGATSVLTTTNRTVELSGRQFTYDNVWDSTTSQTVLYQEISDNLLQSFLDGYNATIMAYGQTGSGKTFTMGSEAHTELDLSESTGLIPRFMTDLFHHLEHQQQQRNHNAEGNNNDFSYRLEASFLEVYGEDVHDLLDPDRPSLPLREDSQGGVVCTGLTVRNIDTTRQALAVLHEGTLHRTTAATLMNVTSSRSHAVFTITLHTTMTSENENTTHNSNKTTVTTSRFTFVDLAGSERMKKTGAEGERAREGIEINKGLLALGNVINALADDERILDGNKKKVHVPYRQSKLTRLLQDALGGNSRTLFLACVSPSDTNASETLSTLHYANRARNIKNAPKRNLDAATLELQHWQAYATILQAELVKQKFFSNNENMATVGEVDEDLMQQKHVNEYLDQLQVLAQTKVESNAPNTKPNIRLPFASMNQVNSSVAISTTQPSPYQQQITNSGTTIGTDANQSILENFDVAMLEEVNPDEEMAILNQLLDLQQRDQDFNNEQKKDSQMLKQVEGELAEQEQLLLQLRDSLKVYHSMKNKYESLMAEVQQLEREKAELQEQLEKASANPTLGCTRAIQKEMEKVERNLVRARSETLKHRELCKKAEQEARKCRILEQKVADLKTGRANLIKKQKEAAARHREYTESKTREIASLKRKARTNEQQMTKLQSEIQIHKRNLDKRQALCNKLLEQKKQTETHLMKLISMRNRELRSRTLNARPRTEAVPGQKSRGKQELCSRNEESDEPNNEKVKSISFLIDKAVSEAVSYAQLKQNYEERIADHGETMRSMVAAVNELDAKRAANSSESYTALEHSIEEMSLKLELIGSALEKIQPQLDRLEIDYGTENGLSQRVISKLIQGQSSDILGALLARTAEKLVEAEIERKNLSQTVTRKVSVVESLEAEVESLSNKITCLNNELVQRHAEKKANTDPFLKIRNLEAKKKEIESKLEDSQQEIVLLQLFSDDLARSHNDLQLNLCRTKERLALVEVALSQSNGVKIPSEILLQLQELWDEIGVSPKDRESSRLNIENCLENTCVSILREARSLKENINIEIEQLLGKISMVSASLGLEPFQYCVQGQSTLQDKQQDLKMYLAQLEPAFLTAMERRNKITAELTNLTHSMGLAKESLEPALLSIINDKDTTENNSEQLISPENLNISDEFLSQCEAAVTRLRIMQSKILADNSAMQQEMHSLVAEMNLSAMDLLYLVVHGIKRKGLSMPEWWNNECAEMTAKAATKEGGVVRSSASFSNHLQLFYASIKNFATRRRLVSDKMRGIIERAQKILLQIVDGELETNEAYSKIHEALFRLPALSKERIHACMSEIEALCMWVESMSQSEVEALTVVWEALNISATKRSEFWGRIDESMREIDAQPAGPFDDVLHAAAADGEEWVLTAVKDSTKNFRQLEMKLFKLEMIHSEVEQLKTHQDAKSRIISLDSELRILNSKLNEFEDKKCVKQRLTTKKNTSSNLLKEERFRKQMQSKFTSKLVQLVKLLKEWKGNENTNFCHDILSEEVRLFLKNSNRNEFMHLRTVEYKGSCKRAADAVDESDSLAPPPKRRAKNLRSTSATLFSSVPTTRKLATKPPHSLPPKRDSSPQRQEKPESARQEKKQKTRSPLSLSQNASATKSTPAQKSKRFTLAPFGEILEQALSPEPFKENMNEPKNR